MTFDPISEQRLDEINPELARRVTQLEQALDAEGIQIRVTQGLRTYAEQDALYAQGRTAPGAKVTNAKGGQSWHNFALSCDVVADDPSKPGFQADWNDQHPAWKRIVEMAPTFGLRDGIAWNDMPHLQLAELPSSPTDEIRAAFEAGGILAVWNSLPGVSGAVNA